MSVRADEEFRSIPRMALVNAERFGDELAVVGEDRRLTYHDAGEEMLRIGRALVGSGIEPGDNVALWAPNSAAWVAAALGVLATGARLVPMNTRFKGTEAAFILQKTEAKMLICAEGFLGFDYVEMVRGADPSVAALKDVVILSGAVSEGTTGWDDFLRRADGVEESVVRDRIEAIRPGDDSDVIFTSGTTGHPKGVRLRHGASLRGYEAFNEMMSMGHGDRIMIVLPFFHCFGYKAGWMAAMMTGATAYPVAVFDPAAALEMIERDRITHMGGAPTLFWAMLDHPTRPQRDLSSMRTAVASAAYIPIELIQRMNKELTHDYAMTGYGLTENHAIVSATRPTDPPEVVANWSGKPLPGVEIRIVDEDGKDVPLGERGEVLVGGWGVTEGYYNDPEATAAILDADGWLHTGDIAYANEDGYFKICDRKKDMFIVGGFNVAPAEVEGLLVDWEKISSVAVIGVPDDHMGEVGYAFVVPTPGTTVTGTEVIAWAREHMANYKVPRTVKIVDALPLNATGKVLKHELRAMVAAGQ